MKKENCQICNVELSPSEIPYVTNWSTIMVCEKHTKYHAVTMPEVIQKHCGYIDQYPEHLTKCGICDQPLTDKEVAALSSMDMRACCAKHAHVSKIQQHDYAILRCLFVETTPQKFGSSSMEGTIVGNNEFNKWVNENPAIHTKIIKGAKFNDLK